jgi:hypothetical protein
MTRVEAEQVRRLKLWNSPPSTVVEPPVLTKAEVETWRRIRLWLDPIRRK